VPATVIVGAQWGDEGKGKIVDLLAQESDLVCRYQGGPNAGHTVIVDGETFKFRHLPSGILSGKLSVLGAGCVVDPGVLLEEIDDLESRGVASEPLRISGNAHLIMPWHIAIDGAGERRLGKLRIGTTRRGIGPAYADKASRLGIRVQDLLDPKILRQKIETALAEKNVWLERVYEHEPFELEQVASTHEGFAQRLRPYVADTSLLVDSALREDKRVLLEGAQGTLLDLDHGTYPFVTSSNPVAGAAATGIGIGPTRIGEVVGVTKAYVTRVGRGPLPSEMDDALAAEVRELGQEFGTVTGRERRPGWLDLVALRYAVRLNGITELALTKLDVLSVFEELKVCVAYRLPDGTETPDFPAHQSDFHHAEPVLESVSGWGEPLDGCETIGDLPDAARAYIELVERALEVPVTLVGTGAAREQVLAPT
jgi:adenylosuccinate synthase